MTIADPTSLEYKERRRKELEESGYVGLTAFILTHPETQKKSIEIASGAGNPCGIKEEKWLNVHAFGSTKTGMYDFNGERIEGIENVASKMRNYVRENYSHLLD
ncbi:hypothetical protein HY449_00765 [Candidatus Pacearchaeota archaeon]|nr:hypothetical protein [Candidatus Pacearchaeota archaeon]